MSCVPGWDVPRWYFASDEPTPEEESFWEMVEQIFDLEDRFERIA